jgi:hypothetical protein
LLPTKVILQSKVRPEGQDGSEEKKEEATRGLEAIGEQMMKGWKLDRALYQKYGGTVIFQ